MSAWLVLSAEPLPPETRRAFPAGSLFLEVTPGLGGAWTDLTPEGEVIRFGVPENTNLKWFRLEHVDDGDNALSLAVRRMVYARQRLSIAVVDPALRDTARHAVAPYGTLVRVELRGESETPEAFAARVAEPVEEASTR